MSAAGLSMILNSQTASDASMVSPVKPGRAYAQELSQALQNGDLAEAQQAYQQLSTYSQNHPGPLENNSQVSQDFAAIGQALQKGDISAAQQAFASLQSAFRSRSTGSNQQTSSPEIVITISDQAAQASATATPGNTSTASSTGSTYGANGIDLTINEGNGSSPITLNISDNAGEALQIDLSNSSNGEMLTLQLGSGSNAQDIQLNFGGGDSASSTASQASGLSVTA